MTINFAAVVNQAMRLTEVERERDALQDEVRRWKRSFAGHVYVPNDEYFALCKERTVLRKLLRDVRDALEEVSEFSGLLTRIDAELERT